MGGFWYEDFTSPVMWAGDGRWNASVPAPSSGEASDEDSR
jgi:hypothetical protein